jgi:hypothetical protein
MIRLLRVSRMPPTFSTASVKGRLRDYAGTTTGVPRIAADLLHRPSRPGAGHKGELATERCRAAQIVWASQKIGLRKIRIGWNEIPQIRATASLIVVSSSLSGSLGRETWIARSKLRKAFL